MFDSRGHLPRVKPLEHMKSKPSGNTASSEKLVAEWSTSPDERRESAAAPKIVIYPPMEDSKAEAARGSGLWRAFGRRLSRRVDHDSLGSGSSSDSVVCDSPCGQRGGRASCSPSDSGSDDSERRRRTSSTVVSLRRVFQSLNLSSRSQSCSASERPPKKNPQPKRILRPPVTYTYVRGLSGLPTQRVPRHVPHGASAGLRR